MITRRILVTTLVNAYGYEHRIYGRFDAVKLINEGWQIKESKFKHYQMKEALFVKYGTCLSNEEAE